MSALNELTNVKNWHYESEDYEAGLPEVICYEKNFSDVGESAAELAELREQLKHCIPYEPKRRVIGDADELGAIVGLGLSKKAAEQLAALVKELGFYRRQFPTAAKNWQAAVKGDE